MELTFNLIDIIDMVIDEVLGYEQLEQINHELYINRRSDKYEMLFNSDEFMNSLSKQLN